MVPFRLHTFYLRATILPMSSILPTLLVADAHVHTHTCVYVAWI